jgi:peptidoglycan/xylan/chitin deacetylase (PgdA/CDA1 family)
MNKDYLTSILSQFFHYISFSCKKPLSEFDTASLIISIDVDVGSPELGVKNGGHNDRNVNNFMTEFAIGKIEEQVVPLLLQVFNEHELPVTFAMRGQLTEIENSIINQILESSTQHDIAAHGYTHRVFTALSNPEAEEELKMISTGMKKLEITPKSFVFPKNQVFHLKLLEKYGYLSFRELGSLFRDGMYVRKHGNLFDVHPSLFLGTHNSVLYEKIINLAVKYRAPLHIWFHPWNLGNSPERAAKRINNVLLPLIKNARKKKNQGVLKFETMCSIAEEYQRLEKIARTYGSSDKAC